MMEGSEKEKEEEEEVMEERGGLQSYL